MTPLERVEALYRELVTHYREAQDAEVRAAAKLLMVAIAELKRYGGPGWQDLLDEYVTIATQDPERFDRMLQGNRTNASLPTGKDELLC